MGLSMKNASLHGLTVVGVFVLAGCSASPPPTTAAPAVTPTAAAPAATATTGAVNDVCPITGDTSDPKFTAEYGGRRIAFCCEHCLREFRGADGAGKAAIAAKVAR